MKVETILQRKVSFYSDITQTEMKARTLFDVLNDIRKGEYAKEILKVRNVRANEGSEKYRKVKKKLPAIAFSGLFHYSRYKFDICNYTQFFVIDLDQLDERLEEVRNQLMADPHIVAVWDSPGGNGLKALLVLEYNEPYDPMNTWVVHEYCAAKQVYRYFKSKYALSLDPQGKDITRLCFVSHDPHIHLKSEFQPFFVRITLTEEKMNVKRNAYNHSEKKRSEIVKFYKGFAFDKDV